MTPSLAVYRIDKFSVPEGSLSEFLRLVGETHQVLRNQAGFVRDYVVEQTSHADRVTVVTFAEWSDEAAYAAAVEAVRRFRQTTGFDTKAALNRLGIDADLGVYRDCIAAPHQP